MPELPEVENIARGLKEMVLGKKIISVNLRREDILNRPAGELVTGGAVGAEALAAIAGKKIISVSRRAKRLLIQLSGGAGLLVQLGMTGRFVITDPKAELEKHAHLIIDLSGKMQLRYVDHRRFGRVWYFQQLDCGNPEPQMLAAGMGKLGPEPFDINAKEFHGILAKSDRNIKTLLLDQTKIAGLGNIYVDESLFAAGIHPETQTNQVSETQAALLMKCIKNVLKKSITAGGTSFSDYRNAYGEMGNFLKMLQVYQRTGQPCKTCKTPIKKITINGRSTHFCPVCQPATSSGRTSPD